jgi:quinol monooxygenase YgiN
MGPEGFNGQAGGQTWNWRCSTAAQWYLSSVDIHRRKFLRYLSAATLMAEPVLAGWQGANGMYGLIVKITAVPGKRADLIKIIKESAMPGCLSYVAAKEENTLWVTEVGDNAASHDASLLLPAVKNAVPHAKAIAAGFERVAVTNPERGVGLERTHVR